MSLVRLQQNTKCKEFQTWDFSSLDLVQKKTELSGVIQMEYLSYFLPTAADAFFENN